jgi:hypothetical protein
MALLVKRDFLASRSIFVGTTGHLTQKRDDPVKNGMYCHPTLPSPNQVTDFHQTLYEPHVTGVNLRP